MTAVIDGGIILGIFLVPVILAVMLYIAWARFSALARLLGLHALARRIRDRNR